MMEASYKKFLIWKVSSVIYGNVGFKSYSQYACPLAEVFYVYNWQMKEKKKRIGTLLSLTINNLGGGLDKYILYWPYWQINIMGWLF